MNKKDIKIHSIETLGAHDGPGIRTVFFLQGCPMRCIYCHNPDALSADGGTLMSAEELCKTAARYKSFYSNGGGVTLSGGEPLMQADGVTKLLALLKKEGIHTALDTSGAVFCPAALDLADLIILDIKHSGADGFKRLTGFPADNTLKTLEYLNTKNKRFIVRQVILTGYTDSEEQVKNFALLTKAAEKIELLPFHNMGAHKYEKLGMEYGLKNMCPPSAEVILKLTALAESVRKGELNGKFQTVY